MPFERRLGKPANQLTFFASPRLFSSRLRKPLPMTWVEHFRPAPNASLHRFKENEDFTFEVPRRLIVTESIEHVG